MRVAVGEGEGFGEHDERRGVIDVGDEVAHDSFVFANFGGVFVERVVTNGGESVFCVECVESFGVGGVGAVDCLGEEDAGRVFVVGWVGLGDAVLPFPFPPGSNRAGEGGELPVFLEGFGEWLDGGFAEIDPSECGWVFGDDGIVVGPTQGFSGFAIVGSEEEVGFGVEIFTEVVADFFEEGAALEKPPFEVGLIEGFVSDEFFTGKGLLKTSEGGVGETDGKVGDALSEPDADEVGFVLFVDHGDFEHLAKVLEGAWISNVDVGDFGEGNVRVGAFGVERAGELFEAESVGTFAAGVFVVREEIEFEFAAAFDDVGPAVFGFGLVDPLVAAVFGGIPSLVGSEFEEIFGERAHTKKLHEAEFLLIPGHVIFESALRGVLASDDVVCHFLPVEEMAFGESLGKGGEWLGDFFERGSFVEFDAFDGDSGGEGIVFRAELEAENPEAIGGSLAAGELGVAWMLEIGKTFLKVEEHVPGFEFPAEWKIEGFRVGVDVGNF